jgi:hypothetical protein
VNSVPRKCIQEWTLGQIPTRGTTLPVTISANARFVYNCPSRPGLNILPANRDAKYVSAGPQHCEICNFRTQTESEMRSHTVGTASLVDRHCFNAHPDPDSTFHFDADPHVDRIPSFTRVGKLGKTIFLLFSIAIPVYNVFLFSVAYVSCF